MQTGNRPQTAADGSGQSSQGTAPAADTQYLLLDHPQWQLQEAVDYRAGLGQLGELEPDLDWYAEYEGTQIDGDDGAFTIPSITFSGHTAGLEERADQLPGFGFRAEDTGGRRTLVAAPSGANPGVVLLELAPDYSVTLLSYDEVVDLRDLAARLTPVDERQWIAAGGQMIDCVPLEPGCAFDD